MLMQSRQPDLWIVVDNSTSPAYDWSMAKDNPLVQYHRIYETKSIGELRNTCMDLALQAGADYIVFWDDDDYYPPERIATGVQTLEETPDADLAASSKMFVLLTKENVFMEVGPFGPKHGTAATYTIRRRYAETHRFLDKSRGEEYDFTNGWTAELVQLPPEKTIIVMGHSRNTVNKSDIYKTPQVFHGRILNDVNGKMVVRTRWPIPWGLFLSTFVDGAYAQLRESIPAAPSYSVIHPTPHIEGIEASDEHRA